MRAADIFWFFFSFGGFVAAMTVFAIWLAASPRSRRARVLLLVVVVAYGAISVYPIPHWGSQQLARPFKPLTRADVPAGRVAVVLLGSGSVTIRDWSGGAVSLPDLIGIERALEAARVFTLTDASWLISSGGRVDPNDPDEPSGVSMKALLVWMGVPDAQIVIERESRDTHDEAVLVKAMLPSLGVDRVVLVTSGMHMRRSLAVFKRAGIDAVPAAALDRNAADHWSQKYLPSGDGLTEAGLVAHELLGLVYYKVRGWV